MSISSTSNSNRLSLLNQNSAYQTGINNDTKDKTTNTANNTANNNDKTTNETNELSGIAFMNADGDAFIHSEPAPLSPPAYNSSGAYNHVNSSISTQLPSTNVYSNSAADDTYTALSEAEFVSALTGKVMQRVYNFFNK